MCQLLDSVLLQWDVTEKQTQEIGLTAVCSVFFFLSTVGEPRIQKKRGPMWNVNKNRMQSFTNNDVYQQQFNKV